MDFIGKWQAERERAAFLALDDGTVWRGVAFGARCDKVGEVVFNTGMSGYQEILTDPSYAGQFVTLTTAEVGNYGVNREDAESRALFLSGLVVNDLTEPSSWRSEMSLDAYLRAAGVPGLYGVDTRGLTLHLRDHGNRRAYLHVADAPLAEAEAVARARAWEGLDGQDYASRVSRGQLYDFSICRGPSTALDGTRPINHSNTLNPLDSNTLNPLNSNTLNPLNSNTPLIVCYDFGVKENILRHLAAWARVTVVPAQTPAEEVLALRPDGVFLSNGPADPSAVTYAVANVRKLLGLRPLNSNTFNPLNSNTFNPLNSNTPIMGICLGHQLLALACGARTARLAFGHHGCNHPVKDLATGRVEITSQNHNFAVVADALPDCLKVTHLNLNDGTIEGLRHKTLPAFSVQYHPEAAPGPHDAARLFDRFRALVAGRPNVV